MSTKKFLLIWLGVIVVLSSILGLLIYLNQKYIEDNQIPTYDELLELYDVKVDLGDRLITCSDGSYDVYTPRFNTQIMLCGQAITDEVKTYLDSLN